MRQVFANSMIEGAPVGNKNAAGPHKRFGSTTSVIFNPEKKSATFRRAGYGKESRFGNITPSSLGRMKKVVSGMERQGQTNVYARGKKWQKDNKSFVDRMSKLANERNEQNRSLYMRNAASRNPKTIKARPPAFWFNA